MNGQCSKMRRTDSVHSTPPPMLQTVHPNTSHNTNAWAMREYFLNQLFPYLSLSHPLHWLLHAVQEHVFADLVLGFQPTVFQGMEVALALSLLGTAGAAAVESALAEPLLLHPQTENHHYHTPWTKKFWWNKITTGIPTCIQDFFRYIGKQE